MSLFSSEIYFVVHSLPLIQLYAYVGELCSFVMHAFGLWQSSQVKLVASLFRFVSLCCIRFSRCVSDHRRYRLLLTFKRLKVVSGWKSLFLGSWKQLLCLRRCSQACVYTHMHSENHDRPATGYGNMEDVDPDVTQTSIWTSDMIRQASMPRVTSD